MFYKKRLLSILSLLVFFLCCALQTRAQLQVIGNSGGNIISEYGSLSWTIGEPVIKTIEGSNYALTQGFHQTNLVVTEIKNTPALSYDMKVYPNPVATTLSIHIENTDISNMSFQIINSSGRLMKSGQINDHSTSVSVQDLVSAIYFLKIFDKNISVKTFKIVKH